MIKSVKKLIYPLIVAITVVNTMVLPVKAETTEDNLREKAIIFEETIKIIDPYVTVDETDDGTNIFTIDIPQNIEDKVDNTIIQAVEENIQYLNEKATDDEITITDNGTIYDTNDDSLSIQSGNVDSFKTYWWGYRRYSCRNCSANIQDGFNKISTGCWGVASAGGLLCLTPAATVGIGATIGGVYTAVMYGWMATDIGIVLRKNPSSGTIISLYLCCAYSIKPQ